jgi:homoserine acetyltransferase
MKRSWHMVDLQHRLVTEKLGIEHLHAILGMSMGGMNAWQRQSMLRPEIGMGRGISERHGRHHACCVDAPHRN